MTEIIPPKAEDKFFNLEAYSLIVDWLYTHDGNYPNKLKWREDFLNFLKTVL